MKLTARLVDAFPHMPRFARSAAFFILGGRNYLLRYRQEFHEHRKFIRDSAAFTKQKQEQWRLQRLQQLISDAVENTEYYASKADEFKPTLGKAILDDTIAQLPVLKKSVFKNRTPEFLNRKYRTATVSSTSGTTGAPVTVQHEAKSLMRRFAFYHDNLNRLGIPSGAPSVRLSGRILSPPSDPRPYLYNPFEKQYFVSTYHLHPRNANVLSDFLHEAEPVFVDGYPSAIVQLLEIASQSRPLPASLRFAITTAETLDPDVIGRIEAFSGVKVRDYYSASEGLPFIQMCPHGTYHARWQSGIFEVENRGVYSREGSGNLVVTSFVQDRMPLIRFETGDWVDGLQIDNNCICGLSGPVVGGVLGRVEDLVVTRDGRKIGMFSYRTLKTIDGLGETQIIQEDVDRFTVKSVGVNLHDIGSIKQNISEKFMAVLGYEVEVDLASVDDIPRGPNGKLRLVECRVQNF